MGIVITCLLLIWAAKKWVGLGFLPFLFSFEVGDGDREPDSETYEKLFLYFKILIS